MKKRIQKLKGLFRSIAEYFVRRARSEDYYDHQLVDRVKYRMLLNKKAKQVEDAVRLEQLPVGDRMVGSKGDTRDPLVILSYKHNTTFLRFRKGKPIAIYVLKKKSEVLAYLVSEEMGPILVKKL